MSIVGTIDWYQSEGVSGTPTTDDLMLGAYPFAFVLEMRQLGAIFFVSGTLNWAERYLIWPRTGDLAEPRFASKAEGSTTHGTMLPDRPLNISPMISLERLFDDSWEAASNGSSREGQFTAMYKDNVNPNVYTASATSTIQMSMDTLSQWQCAYGVSWC